MSKIIKIESCGECSKADYIGTPEYSKKFCTLLSEEFLESTIKDLSIIRPDCPLEDYSMDGKLKRV